ncbi:MAG: hypothetical protein HQL72_08835 [Magnetococcales bacterium]|nr:hypothetical protein [Magnetococcales bacterium]
MEHSYSESVSKLFSLGECEHSPLEKNRDPSKWLNYTELGLTSEHIPELTRLAVDKEVMLDKTGGNIDWAPFHAWRALGQLKAVSAIPILLDHYEVWVEYDWTVSESDLVFGLMGPEAIDGKRQMNPITEMV